MVIILDPGTESEGIEDSFFISVSRTIFESASHILLKNICFTFLSSVSTQFLVLNELVLTVSSFVCTEQ